MKREISAKAREIAGSLLCGLPDLWSGQNPWWNRYLIPVVNFGEVLRDHLAKSTLLTSSWAPGIFSDLLMSVPMLNREWGAEGNSKLPHLFIPSKTTTLVPEFAVEDLPLRRTASLVVELAMKDMPLGRTHWFYIYHQSIPPKGRFSTANSGTKAAVLLKGRSSTANSGIQAAVLLGMDRCGSFLLLSAPHSLFRVWIDLTISENIPVGEESGFG